MTPSPCCRASTPLGAPRRQGHCAEAPWMAGPSPLAEARAPGSWERTTSHAIGVLWTFLMLNPSPQALTAERRGFLMFEHAPGRETGRQWAQQDGLRPVLFNRGCGLQKRTEGVYHRHRFTGASPRGAPRGPAALSSRALQGYSPRSTQWGHKHAGRAGHGENSGTLSLHHRPH